MSKAKKNRPKNPVRVSHDRKLYPDPQFYPSVKIRQSHMKGGSQKNGSH